jgi:methionyl-tRNA formyltransferase
MRIAFFGHDLFSLLPERLQAEGHVVSHIFTCPADRWNSHDEVVRFAARNSVPVLFDPPVLSDIEACLAAGVEALLVAAYPYRIPGTDRIRGINLHPTLLPFGRGRCPVPWLIMRYRDQAAVTLHKLAPKMDTGDILLQQPIPLDPLEDMETFCAKLRSAAPALIAGVLSNFDTLWSAAIPQGTNGSYWPSPTDADRTFDSAMTVTDNLRILRAFGKFGARAVLDGRAWKVGSAHGWEEPHALPCGTLVNRSDEEVVLAVSDGFLALRQLTPETSPEL